MPHIIKGNKGSKLPKVVISVDCETRQSQSTANEAIKVHNLWGWTAWIAYYRNGMQLCCDPRCGRDANSFWLAVKCVCETEKEVYIVAHNANFDMAMLQLPRLIDIGDFDVSFACLESPPYIVSGKLYGSKVHVLDTLNYYNMPLAELGRLLGLPKLPMPVLTAPDTEWMDYCWRDSEIVHRVMRDLIGTVREEDWGNFRLTAASQGWNAYRHRWMDRDIRVHNHKQTLSLEREAYYGGCERLFRYGDVKGPLYQIDMNWAYGTAMAMDIQPYKAVDYFVAPTLDQATDVLQTSTGCARVVVDTKSRSYPVRINNRVEYATGRFVTTLCGLELQEAIKSRHIAYVGFLAVYLHDDLFGTFVSNMYNTRQLYEAMDKPHIGRLCKSMVNGLYGKFAQTIPSWEEDTKRFPLFAGEQWHSYDCETGKLYTHRQLARRIQTLCGRDEGDDSVPILSACIAAGVRVRMQIMIDQIGVKNCILQYCDSLIVTANGLHEAQNKGLISNNDPGRLKIVSKHKEGTFYSPTDMVLDGQHKICGIPHRAIEVEAGVYQYDHWESPHEVFSRQPDGTILVIPQTRIMKRQPPPQGVDSKGFVLPIVIDQTF